MPFEPLENAGSHSELSIMLYLGDRCRTAAKPHINVQLAQINAPSVLGIMFWMCNRVLIAIFFRVAQHLCMAQVRHICNR